MVKPDLESLSLEVEVQLFQVEVETRVDPEPRKQFVELLQDLGVHQIRPHRIEEPPALQVEEGFLVVRHLRRRLQKAIREDAELSLLEFEIKKKGLAARLGNVHPQVERELVVQRFSLLGLHVDKGVGNQEIWVVYLRERESRQRLLEVEAHLEAAEDFGYLEDAPLGPAAQLPAVGHQHLHCFYIR